MAVRNLRRNTWRTAITATAVAASVLLTVTGGHVEYGAWQDRLDASVTTLSGHVVVQAPGYQHDPRPRRTVADSGALAQQVQQAAPDARVLRRAFVGGLLTSPRNNAAVMVQGVDVQAEAPVTRLDETLERNRAALAEQGMAQADIDEQVGQFLQAGDDRGLLLGATIAETLEVSVGDKVVLMTQVGDDMESVPLRVRGVFRTGVDLTDGFTAMADLSALQPLLPGADPAHQIAVHLDSVDRAPAVQSDVLAALSPADAADEGDGLDVRTWDQAMPQLKAQMELDRGASQVIYSFVFVIIAVVILSTLLMSVMERTREFGVLLALGMRPREVAALIVTESFLLGVLATLVGLVLHIPLAWYLIEVGFDYGDMMANSSDLAGVVIDPVIRAQIDWDSLVFYSISAIVLTMLASVWPAWRATRLQPVDAMRSV